MLFDAHIGYANIYLQLKVFFDGGVRHERLPLVRPLPQPEDDGRVADEDRHEGKNELGDGREESVRNPAAENWLD